MFGILFHSMLYFFLCDIERGDLILQLRDMGIHFDINFLGSGPGSIAHLFEKFLVGRTPHTSQ